MPLSKVLCYYKCISYNSLSQSKLKIESSGKTAKSKGFRLQNDKVAELRLDPDGRALPYPLARVGGAPPSTPLGTMHS